MELREKEERIKARVYKREGFWGFYLRRGKIAVASFGYTGFLSAFAAQKRAARKYLGWSGR